MAHYMTTDGNVEDKKVRNFAHAQELVGGMVEVVRGVTMTGRLFTMLVNEEGLLLGLPLNTTATVYSGQEIVGNALVLTDAEVKRVLR